MSSGIRRSLNSRLGDVQQPPPQYAVLEVPNDGHGQPPSEQEVTQALQRSQPIAPPPGYQYSYEPAVDNNSNAIGLISKLSGVVEDFSKGVHEDLDAMQQRLVVAENKLSEVHNTLQWAMGEIQKLNGMIAQQRSQPVVPPVEFSRYQRVVSMAGK
jgi:hypothetical protein